MFFILVLLGFFLNLVLVCLGGWLWRRKDPLDQTFFMYCISGYNIGNFSLPFIQSFFPIAVPFLCMFDIGNSFMISGGTTLLVDHFTRLKKETSLKKIIVALLKILPFTTYLVIFLMKIFSLSFSKTPIAILQLFANANGFLSMLMIGLYLELKIPRKERMTVLQILLGRYLLGILSASLFYFVIPFPPLIKIVLVLLSIAPIPTFAVINSVKSGIAPEVTGFISSISILISLLLMTLTMLLIL